MRLFWLGLTSGVVPRQLFLPDRRVHPDEFRGETVPEPSSIAVTTIDMVVIEGLLPAAPEVGQPCRNRAGRSRRPRS